MLENTHLQAVVESDGLWADILVRASDEQEARTKLTEHFETNRWLKISNATIYFCKITAEAKEWFGQHAIIEAITITDTVMVFGIDQHNPLTPIENGVGKFPLPPREVALKTPVSTSV